MPNPDANDPTPVTPAGATPIDPRTPRVPSSLIGENLAMILTMAAIVGLMVGVVVLVELLA